MEALTALGRADDEPIVVDVNRRDADNACGSLEGILRLRLPLRRVLVGLLWGEVGHVLMCTLAVLNICRVGRVVHDTGCIGEARRRETASGSGGHRRVEGGQRVRDGR